MSPQPPVGISHFIVEVTNITLGKTSLDGRSARHKDLYRTTHNTHNRRTSVLPVGFEPAFPAASAEPNFRPCDHWDRPYVSSVWLNVRKVCGRESSVCVVCDNDVRDENIIS
jgi:hypothetical protein